MRNIKNIFAIAWCFLALSVSTNAQSKAGMPTGETLNMFTQQNFQWNFNLDNGSKVNPDRNYTFSNVPSFLKGSTYVMTTQNDKMKIKNDLYKMQSDKAITYYVGHDVRFRNQLPQWLKNWNNTNQTYSYADTKFKIYKLDAQPNQMIIFGGNRPSSNASGNAMYNIFMQPAKNKSNQVSEKDKLDNYLEIEFKDFFIVEDDDAAGGEDIYGYITVAAPYYGNNRVLNRNDDDKVMHGDANESRSYDLRRYMKNKQNTFYIRYSDKHIYEENHKLRIIIHLKEDDSGEDMDMKRVEHEFSLKEIFSGASVDKHTQTQALKTWYGNLNNNRNTYNQSLIDKAKGQFITDPHCKASAHSDADDSNTKVMLRYILKPVQSVPSNYKIGF